MVTPCVVEPLGPAPPEPPDADAAAARCPTIPDHLRLHRGSVPWLRNEAALVADAQSALTVDLSRALLRAWWAHIGTVSTHARLAEVVARSITGRVYADNMVQVKRGRHVHTVLFEDPHLGAPLAETGRYDQLVPMDVRTAAAHNCAVHCPLKMRVVYMQHQRLTGVQRVAARRAWLRRRRRMYARGGFTPAEACEALAEPLAPDVPRRLPTRHLVEVVHQQLAALSAPPPGTPPEEAGGVAAAAAGRRRWRQHIQRLLLAERVGAGRRQVCVEDGSLAAAEREVAGEGDRVMEGRDIPEELAHVPPPRRPRRRPLQLGQEEIEGARPLPQDLQRQEGEEEGKGGGEKPKEHGGDGGVDSDGEEEEGSDNNDEEEGSNDDEDRDGGEGEGAHAEESSDEEEGGEGEGEEGSRRQRRRWQPTEEELRVMFDPAMRPPVPPRYRMLRYVEYDGWTAGMLPLPTGGPGDWRAEGVFPDLGIKHDPDGAFLSTSGERFIPPTEVPSYMRSVALPRSGGRSLVTVTLFPLAQRKSRSTSTTHFNVLRTNQLNVVINFTRGVALPVLAVIRALGCPDLATAVDLVVAAGTTPAAAEAFPGAAEFLRPPPPAGSAAANPSIGGGTANFRRLVEWMLTNSEGREMPRPKAASARAPAIIVPRISRMACTDDIVDWIGHSTNPRCADRAARIKHFYSAVICEVYPCAGISEEPGVWAHKLAMLAWDTWYAIVAGLVTREVDFELARNGMRNPDGDAAVVDVRQDNRVLFNRDEYRTKRMLTLDQRLTLRFTQAWRGLGSNFRKRAGHAVAADPGAPLAVMEKLAQCPFAPEVGKAVASGSFGTDQAAASTTMQDVSQAVVAINLLGKTAQLLIWGRNVPKRNKTRTSRRTLADSAAVQDDINTPDTAAGGLQKRETAVAALATGVPREVLWAGVRALLEAGRWPWVPLWGLVLDQHAEAGGVSAPAAAAATRHVAAFVRPTRLLVNGVPLAVVDAPASLLPELRAAKRTGGLPPETAVTWDPAQAQLHVMAEAGGPRFPTLVLEQFGLAGAAAGAAGVLALVRNPACQWPALEAAGLVEQLSPAEAAALHVRWWPTVGAGHRDNDVPAPPPYTHTLLDAAAGLLSHITGLIPWPQSNMTCRLSLSGQAQGNSIHRLWEPPSNQNSYTLLAPQRPLVGTVAGATLGLDSAATGTGSCALYINEVRTGNNVEDAHEHNADAAGLGFGVALTFHAITRVAARPEAVPQFNAASRGGETELFTLPGPWTFNTRVGDHSLLRRDGLPRAGDRGVTQKHVVLGRVALVREPGSKPPRYREEDKSVMPRPFTGHMHVHAVELTRLNRREQATVVLAQAAVPASGDKFTTRHGQKGVSGAGLHRVDLTAILLPRRTAAVAQARAVLGLARLTPPQPARQRLATAFELAALPPQHVKNSHGFPSRMTAADALEQLGGALAVAAGRRLDGTAWSASPPGGLVAALAARGHLPEALALDPRTGALKEGRIAAGFTLLLRQRQIAAEKRYERGREGPVNPQTRQPTRGRQQHGGFRVGHMEGWGMMGAGGARTLQGWLRDAADPSRALLCSRCGVFATAAPPSRDAAAAAGTCLPRPSPPHTHTPSPAHQHTHACTHAPSRRPAGTG